MSEEGDRRSVATDALATLGTIIGPNEKRDAIHLAVEPVEAGEELWPSAHILVRFGKAYRAPEEGMGMGIVDPFLTERVQRGQRFWFIMYPRQVRSLRHVWSHPDFPDEGAPGAPVRDVERSEMWLREYCATHGGPSYENLLTAVRGGTLHPDYGPCENDGQYLLIMGADAHGPIAAEMWDHVETVTGLRNLPRATHFSCSC